MTKKQNKNMLQHLQDKMNEVSINGVSSGYKEMAKSVLDMIKDKKNIEDIKSYCEWIVENNENITKVAIDTKK